MKKRKGMSLVEVMMSFVLIGFIVLLVSGAVTSTYKTSTAMQDLPGLYFAGQEEVENELDDLEKKVTKKYLLEREAVSDEEAAGELAALNAELEENHEIDTVKLFGKDVTLYRFTKEYTDEDSGVFALHAGTASGVRLERPVPVLESATASPLGGSATAEVTDASGKLLSASVTYADTNSEYRYTELYQWYVSTTDAHAVYYSDGTPGPDELQHGKVMPVYPDDFTLIPSGRSATLTVTGEYEGHFLFCLVTPLSINGKMGDSVMSNLIYVSALPAGPVYRAVIDPSLAVLDYAENGHARITKIDSTSAANGVFIANSILPYIDQSGDRISENMSTASRFLHFGAGENFKSLAGFKAQAGDEIFAVVRSADGGDFIKAGDNTYGCYNNTYASTPTAGGWMLITATVNADAPEYIIGSSPVDIAELIIAGGGDNTASAAYLTEKYGLG